MKFEPGFRISLVDTIFIVLIGAAAIYAIEIDPFVSIALALPCFQFFLFCNVFRISRKPELVWAGAYLIVFAISHHFGVSAFIPSAIMLSIGFVAIYLETKKPGYHGVWWESINPNLESWFHENVGVSSQSNDSSKAGQGAAEDREIARDSS